MTHPKAISRATVPQVYSRVGTRGREPDEAHCSVRIGSGTPGPRKYLVRHRLATKARPRLELGGIPIDYKAVDFVDEIRRLNGDIVDVVFDDIVGKHLSHSYKG